MSGKTEFSTTDSMEWVLMDFLKRIGITAEKIKEFAERIESKLQGLAANLKKNGLKEVELKTPHSVLGWFGSVSSGTVVFTGEGKIFIKQPASRFGLQGKEINYPEKRSPVVSTEYFVKRWLQQPSCLAQQSDMPDNPSNHMVRDWSNFYSIENLEKLIEEETRKLS